MKLRVFLLAALLSCVTASPGTLWNQGFRTRFHDYIWTTLVGRQVPIHQADGIAECMVRKFEIAFPKQEDFQAWLDDGQDDDRSEKFFRECVGAPEPKRPLPIFEGPEKRTLEL